MKIWFKDMSDEVIEVEGEFIREDLEEGFVYLEVNGKEESFISDLVLKFEE